MASFGDGLRLGFNGGVWGEGKIRGKGWKMQMLYSWKSIYLPIMSNPCWGPRYMCIQLQY